MKITQNLRRNVRTMAVGKGMRVNKVRRKNAQKLEVMRKKVKVKVRKNLEEMRKLRSLIAVEIPVEEMTGDGSKEVIRLL
ncbi:hypothetical protein [Vibrio salinus]|uniref:hypothetical protein n=1 Tax=Vibrio salinus TaxID=2899784 RepID=UPI001E4A253A|nr:hypothetical protein [Vibrio salinus]MCE0495764.1 hypothetical protein [Vibrio salinus]